MPVQVDALVSEEVRRGPEDPLVVVIGQDPDQGAVHVEDDRSDVHSFGSGLLARQGVAPSLDRRSEEDPQVASLTGTGQQTDTGDLTARMCAQAACSILFACRTSLRP